MWRKSLHEKAGYFDPNFITSGDLDFWIRASEVGEFKKINRLLGLYLKRDDSVEHSNNEAKYVENSVITYKYAPVRANITKQWSFKQVKNRLEKITTATKQQQKGLLDECIVTCNELLHDIPNDVDILYLKATSYYRKQQFAVAIKLFEDILKINAKHSPTLNNLAVWYWANGEKKAAVELMTRCCETDKNNVNARFNLADMYASIGKTEKAMEWYKEVLNRNPYHREAIRALKDYYKKRDSVLYQYYLDLEVVV
jgi:tetratricopeptide (TPR) repeat protein